MNVMVIQEGINFKHAEMAKGNGRVEFFIDFDYNFLNEYGETYSEADLEGCWEYDFLVGANGLVCSRTKIINIDKDKYPEMRGWWWRDEAVTEKLDVQIFKR